MENKKLIISSIVLATIFLFGIVKPMEESDMISFNPNDMDTKGKKVLLDLCERQEKLKKCVEKKDGKISFSLDDMNIEEKEVLLNLLDYQVKYKKELIEAQKKLGENQMKGASIIKQRMEQQIKEKQMNGGST